MMRNQPSLLYGIQNSDITEFMFKLHVLGGDYMRDAERNLGVLARQGCTDYIALMSEQHIRLEDATLIYQKGMDFNQRLFTSEFRNERAFLLHVTAEKDGHAHGDILLMDCDTLRRDVELHGPSPIGIVASDKDGTEKSISFEEWGAMDMTQKEALHSWRYQYFFSGEKETMRQLCADVFSRWKGCADMRSADDLLRNINIDYMIDAECYKGNMLRIPQEMAKQMLLYQAAGVRREV